MFLVCLCDGDSDQPLHLFGIGLQVQGTQWTLAGGALLTGATTDVGPCATLPAAAAFACARGPGLQGVRSVLEVGDKHDVPYTADNACNWCP